MGRILTKQQRLDALARLGQIMRSPDEALQQVINTAHFHNAWFTPENTRNAVVSFGEMLNAADLEKWSEQWDAEADVRSRKSEAGSPKSEVNLEPTTYNLQLKIGLILAGNIPLVGLHDVICVLAAGHIALIKLSSQDSRIIPFLLNKLVVAQPAFAEQIQLIEKLEGYDAVIATGSNNTSRYFEHYFSKVPHIIRKNRNSVAVLTGRETTEQLEALGKDIFTYFGLGCRNVSKLYVPKNYQFDTFFQAIEKYKPVIDHHKYHNNYDYNKSILLVNREPHLDNGFLLLKPDDRLTSPLAVLHYEEYENAEAVKARLQARANEIQCTVSDTVSDISAFSFGQAQYPKLWEYADGVDTMKFLTSL